MSISIKYTKKVEIFKENEKGLNNTFKMEYLSDVNSLKTNKENNELKEEIVYGAHNKDTDRIPYSVLGIIKKDKFFYKPNETKRLLGDWARTYTENSLKNCYEIKDSKSVFQSNPFFTPNYIGKRLVSVIYVSLYGIFNRKCTEDANIIETQLLLALKAYEQDNLGKKAAALSDLIPKYLSEILRDPFTGNSVEYSPKNGIKINKEKIN